MKESEREKEKKTEKKRVLDRASYFFVVVVCHNYFSGFFFFLSKCKKSLKICCFHPFFSLSLSLNAFLWRPMMINSNTHTHRRSQHGFEFFRNIFSLESLRWAYDDSICIKLDFLLFFVVATSIIGFYFFYSSFRNSLSQISTNNPSPRKLHNFSSNFKSTKVIFLFWR